MGNSHGSKAENSVVGSSSELKQWRKEAQALARYAHQQEKRAQAAEAALADANVGMLTCAGVTGLVASGAVALSLRQSGGLRQAQKMGQLLSGRLATLQRSHAAERLKLQNELKAVTALQGRKSSAAAVATEEHTVVQKLGRAAVAAEQAEREALAAAAFELKEAGSRGRVESPFAARRLARTMRNLLDEEETATYEAVATALRELNPDLPQVVHTTEDCKMQIARGNGNEALNEDLHTEFLAEVPTADMEMSFELAQEQAARVVGGPVVPRSNSGSSSFQLNKNARDQEGRIASQQFLERKAAVSASRVQHDDALASPLPSSLSVVSVEPSMKSRHDQEQVVGRHDQEQGVRRHDDFPIAVRSMASAIWRMITNSSRAAAARERSGGDSGSSNQGGGSGGGGGISTQGGGHDTCTSDSWRFPRSWAVSPMVVDTAEPNTSREVGLQDKITTPDSSNRNPADPIETPQLVSQNAAWSWKTPSSRSCQQAAYGGGWAQFPHSPMAAVSYSVQRSGPRTVNFVTNVLHTDAESSTVAASRHSPTTSDRLAHCSPQNHAITSSQFLGNTTFSMVEDWTATNNITVPFRSEAPLATLETVDNQQDKQDLRMAPLHATRSFQDGVERARARVKALARSKIEQQMAHASFDLENCTHKLVGFGAECRTGLETAEGAGESTQQPLRAKDLEQKTLAMNDTQQEEGADCAPRLLALSLRNCKFPFRFAGVAPVSTALSSGSFKTSARVNPVHVSYEDQLFSRVESVKRDWDFSCKIQRIRGNQLHGLLASKDALRAHHSGIRGANAVRNMALLPNPQGFGWAAKDGGEKRIFNVARSVGGVLSREASHV